MGGEDDVFVLEPRDQLPGRRADVLRGAPQHCNDDRPELRGDLRSEATGLPASRPRRGSPLNVCRAVLEPLLAAGRVDARRPRLQATGCRPGDLGSGQDIREGTRRGSALAPRGCPCSWGWRSRPGRSHPALRRRLGPLSFGLRVGRERAGDVRRRLAEVDDQLAPGVQALEVVVAGLQDRDPVAGEDEQASTEGAGSDPQPDHGVARRAGTAPRRGRGPQAPGGNSSRRSSWTLSWTGWRPSPGPGGPEPGLSELPGPRTRPPCGAQGCRCRGLPGRHQPGTRRCDHLPQPVQRRSAVRARTLPAAPSSRPQTPSSTPGAPSVGRPTSIGEAAISMPIAPPPRDSRSITADRPRWFSIDMLYGRASRTGRALGWPRHRG